MTKNYSVRIGDDKLQARITAYAKSHGIPESTAIVRLLQEGEKAAEGKPITRFAVLDPAANETLSLALGELRLLAEVLSRCCSALARPRPLQPDEVDTWNKDKEAARKAFELTKEKIDQLKRAVHLEFLLTDLTTERLETLFQWGIGVEEPAVVSVFGALLGKTPIAPTEKPTPPVEPEKNSQS